MKELDGIAAKWFSFGIHLEVPYHELEIIHHDHGKNARRCMAELMKWWLDHDLEAKWSTIVQTLAQIGRKPLAYAIAHNHGLCKIQCTTNLWEGGKGMGVQVYRRGEQEMREGHDGR